MRPIFLSSLIVILQFGSISFYAQCGNLVSAIYGSENSNQRGYSLAPALEGDAFYVGGLKDDSLQLLKLNLNGQVLWARTFDVVPGEIDHVSSMIVDSEGMIAMTGLSGNIISGDLFFAMRYNPIADVVLWARTYMSSNVIYPSPIIQKGDGGNYLVTSNPHEISSMHGDDSEILELNKNTGEVVLNFAKQYHLGASETLASMVYDSAFIYGNGRYTDGEDDPDMRHTIIKLDANTGIPVWTKLGHLPANSIARIYGYDIILHEGVLYSGSFGDPNGATLSNTKLYLQKTDTDGNVIWLKQYELPGPNDVGIEMVQSGDGIVILAGKRAFPSELILYKVDFEGEMLWSRLFQFPGAITTIGNTHAKSNQLIQVGDKIAFTGYGTNISGGTNMIIVITNLQGEADSPCVEDSPLNIQVTTVNGVFYDVTPTVTNVNPPTQDYFPESIVTQPQLVEECTTPDTLFEIINISICEGEVFEGYSITGIYTDTFFTNTGCDSIRTLVLTVTPSINFTLSKNICHDESFEGYTISGTYADTFQVQNGCDSIRILELTSFGCTPIIHYDLNACTAYMHDGSNMDYSEFTPTYPEFTCAVATAEILHRTDAQENKHSCTPGVNNSVAMCVSSFPTCTYTAGSNSSVVIEFSVDPLEDSLFIFSRLEFYEKAPSTYVWINGPSGLNNYPLRYGIRILKDGVEIFRNEAISTNLNWTLQSFNFIDNALFRVESATSFKIELLPYCPVGNGATVSAWDLDEVRIYAACAPVENNAILGQVLAPDGRYVNEVEVRMSETPEFDEFNLQSTQGSGNYLFNKVVNSLNYLKGYKNDGVLNGVSTVDIIYMQKHLLGINQFTSLAEYVAADINYSSTVTVMDILELRKLILGINDEFPRNTSWRFGPAEQDMNQNNLASFKEMHEIHMNTDTAVGNFLGIKIGDLNGDVQLQASSNPIEPRNKNVFIISIYEQQTTNPAFTTLDVKSENAATILGLQCAIDFTSFEIISIEPGRLNIERANFHIEDKLLKISWNASKEVNISPDDVLFKIVVKANQEIKVNEAISLNLESLKPEAYSSDLEISEIIMKMNSLRPTSNGQQFLNVTPNPMLNSAKVSFYLNENGIATLQFYDMSGRLIHTVRNVYQAGFNEELINRQQLPGPKGFVYCQLISGSSTMVQKFLLLD